jgi:hypothetical protein
VPPSSSEAAALIKLRRWCTAVTALQLHRCL